MSASNDCSEVIPQYSLARHRTFTHNFASAVSECLRVASGNHVSDGLCTSASFGSMPLTPVWSQTCRMPFPNILTSTDISGWDTSNVVDMSAMFESASLFDQDISLGYIRGEEHDSHVCRCVLVQSKHWGSWDTSQVRSMKKCFTKLLLSIRTSGLDTSQVRRRHNSGEYYNKMIFHEDIGGWC